MADDEASAFLLNTAQFVFESFKNTRNQRNQKTILLEKTEFATQKQQGNSKTTGRHFFSLLTRQVCLSSFKKVINNPPNKVISLEMSDNISNRS